jgi:hypothetical protein
MAGLFDNMFGNVRGGLLGGATEEDPRLQALLGGGSNNLSNTLLGLGAGIAGGSTWGESVSGGIKGIAAARAADQQRTQLVQQAQMLVQMGLPPQHAIMAVQNPKMMEAILPHVVPKYSHITNGPLGGAFNEATGRVSNQYAAPSWQTVGPGQTGLFATPPGYGPPAAAPTAAGGPPAGTVPPGVRVAPGAAPVISVPEAPPTGTQWKDPSDPRLGVDNIIDGPNTQLTEGMAGRLAMLKAAKPELDAARDFFGEKFNSYDPTNYPAQTMGIGEVARKQRGVKMAAEAALRMATGAAAPTSEDLKYLDFYVPTVFDSLATRQQKLDALSRFMTEAEKNMLQGRTTRIQEYLPPGSAPQSVQKNNLQKKRDPMELGR